MTIIRRLVTQLGYKVEDRELKGYTKSTEQAKQETEKFADEVVDAEAKIKGFGKVMDRIRSAGPALGSAIKKGAVVGAAAAVGLVVLLRQMAGEFDEIAKTSGKLGVATDELQRLRFALKLSGGEAEVLNTAIKDFNKFIFEGREAGVTPFTTALDKLGLGIDSFKGLNFEGTLSLVADRLKLVKDGQDRAVLSQRIFGEEAGRQLLPLVNAGSEGIRAMGDNLRDLGGIINEETLKAAESFNDEMDRLFVVTKAQVAGALSDLLPLARDLTKQFSDWAKANRDVIKTDASGFVSKLVDTFKAVVEILGEFLELWDSLVDALGGSKEAFIAAGVGLAALKAAASGALGPLGSLAALLIGLLPVAVAIGNKLGDILSKDASLRALSGRAPKSAAELLAENEKLGGTETGKKVLFARQSIDLARTRLRELIEDRGASFAGAGQGTILQQRRARQEAEERIRDQIKFFQVQEQQDLNRFRKEQAAEVASGRAAVAPTAAQSKTFERFIELSNKSKRTAAENAELGRLRRQLNQFAPTPTGGAGAPAAPRLTADELVAKALTPGGGGLGALRGLSPGTTINQINASITTTTTINVPLDQLPRDATLRETVDMVTREVARVTSEERDEALAQQRQQILG